MKNIKIKSLMSIIIVGLFLTGMLTPLTQGTELEQIRGFDEGPSHTDIVPLKKATFVKFDKEKLNDDLAYLANIPISVFKEDNKLFSHPLLFHQDKNEFDDDIKYKIQDASDGVDYFMDDWMSYCDGELDQLNLIGIDKTELNKDLNAKETKSYSYDNPYLLANEIALSEWSYSDEVVVAVTDEQYKSPKIESEGKVQGVIPSGYDIESIKLDVPTPEIGVGASFGSFEVTNPYKYVVANMYWDNVAIDLDLQLYDSFGRMVDADSKWNVFYGAGETASSYVYNEGTWKVGVTYMPTQQSNKKDGILKQMALGEETRDVDVTLYPGTEIEIDDSVPYGCRDVEFTLEWNDPNIALGFVILDPTGAETATSPSNEEIIAGIDKGATKRKIKMERLGETQENEKYKIGVFSLDEISRDIDFTIHYEWKQNISREKGDNLASATNGAVLASMLNSPLLYTHKDKVYEDTINTLYKLGVKNIHLIDLGNYKSKDVKDSLNEISALSEYTEYKDLYDEIKKYSGSDDVVFSTIDPWTYYYSEFPVPQGEYPGAYFFGPAAFIAAHHGSPVIIVDNHPVLSQSVVWHTEFWRNTANNSFRPDLPSVSSMYLTGKNVVNFLESYGFKIPKAKEELATMITVADQFDIGATWDRTFAGRLIPGRFSSSPVDIAYWMARNIFYPGLIFENPAMKGKVTLVNGSSSKVSPYIGKLRPPFGTDLVITKDQKELDYEYPLLHTYNVYLYKFNEIAAEKHWGGYYTTADGNIPYITTSNEPIDQGAAEGKTAAYVPDLHETYATPFYARKAGYSNCFSTNYDKTIDNLNSGVLMWMESCHGGNLNYGNLQFWNPDSPYVNEENPWRAYERPLLSLGDIKEFTQYAPEWLHEMGLPSFTILFKIASLLSTPLNLITVDKGSTENPDVAVMNPQLPALLSDSFSVDLHIKESKGLSLIPLLGRMFRAYGDGVVIDPLPGGENVLTGRNGLRFDEDLGNLHSMGFNAVSCLVAYTYLHQVMIRHGTPYQILDPWSTSWYSGIWLHSIPRQIALGHTIGEAYEQGMAEVGIQYLNEQWWWDLNENVVFFGDPDLRVWAPETEFDKEGKNNWDLKDVQAASLDSDVSINGHMPFGATHYPHEKEPQPMLPIWLIGVIIVIILLLVALVAIGKRKK